jgi:hypothetical protein
LEFVRHEHARQRGNKQEHKPQKREALDLPRGFAQGLGEEEEATGPRTWAPLPRREEASFFGKNAAAARLVEPSFATFFQKRLL